MKKYLKYVLPSLITFLILGIIFYFNDLFPFGKYPLVQVDADYIYIPILYKIYDVLHGNGNIIYTNLGLGQALYPSLITQGSLFSPLNLLLYFVKRDNIIDYFGLFIIIKLCLVSLTSYIYIEKTHKVNYFYKVLFAILYTFNGFIILNYFNEIWLDIVIIFPLLVLYLNKLLKEEKSLGYIITLSISLIISFYYSYFVVIFILFYSFIYINIYGKKNKKQIVFKLGIGTIIAILISAFSSLPLMYQIYNSSRFSYQGFADMFGNIGMKSLYILFCPIELILLVLLVSKFKKDKVNIYSYLILAVLYLIPVIIDPINALLHGGSFWSFPYRYGFITAFILMDISLCYLSKYAKDKNIKVNTGSIVAFILIVDLAAWGIKMNFDYRNSIITEGILLEVKNATYINMLQMILIVFVMYILGLLINNKYFKYATLGMVSLYTIFLFTTWTIYYNRGYYLCTNARELSRNVKLEKDGRYKVEYQTYTPGYGLMYQVNTLDNWLHIIPKDSIDVYKKLGYYISDTNVHSVGGTIFSDYLLNNRYLISKEFKSNDDMFTLVDNYNYKYIYRYNYSQNYGVVFDNLFEIDEGNVFDYQNTLYKKLYNQEDNIINYRGYAYLTDEVIELTYEVTDPSYLYFNTSDYKKISKICINDNCIYDFKKYVKYLGYYDTDTNIKVYANEGSRIYFDVASIKKSDIIKLDSPVKYKNDKYYVTVPSEKYLFLPINNISGIKVYNNGKEIKTEKCLNNFICLKLNKGKNMITIKYSLPLFRMGIILSLVGLVSLCFYKKLVPNKLLQNLAYYLFNTLVLGVFLYYYFYALFKYVV